MSNPPAPHERDAAPAANVRFEPLSPETFDDFVAMHERPECAGCFCTYWHFPGDNRAWQMAVPADNLARKRSLVERGETLGMLAYVGGRVVGTVQVGRRDGFDKLTRRMPYAGLDVDEHVWAVVCFSVLAEHRGRGIARGLLEAAIEYVARQHGARAVEAFPRRGEGLGPAEVWTGPEEIFLAAGFEVVREHPQYPVLRRGVG